MKVLIIGNGISGKSANKYLKSLGYETEILTDDELNMLSENEKDRLLKGLSFIVVSPGVSKNSNLVKRARQLKIKIVCEFELGSKNLNNIIAITGTNGKTTTAKLTYFLLSGTEKTIHLGGNIGIPATQFAQNTIKDDISVLEASSFQLAWSQRFKPHIAAILNISEDHLSWHKTMKNYISSKLKITKNQTVKDYLVLNADDKILMQNIPKTKAKIFYFSTKKKVCGCYVKKGSIYFNDNHFEEKLADTKNIRLVGDHNLSNVLCSVLVVYLQTKNKNLFSRLCDFHGEAHRIEYVKTLKGISFFNDSKATNISSVFASTKSFKCGINLILGGSEKGYSFDKLFANLPKNVKNIAVFGQTKQKIIESAKKFQYDNIYVFETLKQCVLALFYLSKKGEIILLSPACASFDQFKNYEERGNVFKKIVEELSVYENAFAESEKT